MNERLTLLNHFWNNRGWKFLLEALIWVFGIAVLALMNPEGEHLFSFCPISWITEDGCLGCGLGHGIAYLFRGEWEMALKANPLTIPAVLVLSWRCIQLVRWFKQYQDKLLTLNNI